MKKSRRKLIPFVSIILILIILICLLFIWYTFSGNYINMGYVDDTKQEFSNSEVDKSSIIIADGIVLGASSGDKWIPVERFYEVNSSKTSFDVDVFSENQSYGTFKTASLKRYDKTTIYTTLAKAEIPNKYLAISSGDQNGILPGMTKLEPTSVDEQYVKESLGAYKYINGSIKITEVYATNINQTTDKIICAISKKANILGVYSVVVYVTENKPYVIKYAAARDTKESSRWPIFSLQFVMDLNKDTKPEIILRELTGDDVAYTVLELRKDNKFYEVLRSTVVI